MKRTVFSLLVLTAPAALYSQPAGPAAAGAPVPVAAATDTVKAVAAEKVTVIEPVAAPSAKKAAAKPKAAVKTATKAAPLPAKSEAAAEYAAKYLHVRPGAPVVGAGEPSAVKTAAVPAKPEERTEGGFRVLKRHTIVPGDTLWDLAGKYYNNPFMWGRIYNANFNSVSNPDLIYPKNELIIPDISELLIPYRTPEVTASDITPAAPPPAPAAAPAPQPAAPRTAAAPALSEGDDIPDLGSNYLSEDMPEDQKEWSDGVKVVPDSWTEDGVITAKLKNDDDFLEEGMSSYGEILEISMERSGAVRPGDYLNIYLRGTDAFDKNGECIGRELQYAGSAEVFSADGTEVKARVVDAATAIYKDYVVKKK